MNSLTEDGEITLSQCDSAVEGKFLQWLCQKLNERKEHIFRKKTLYKRLPVLQWLPSYSTSDIVPDILAGITVGITVIPQSLAYATLAGLPPQYGLYAAFIGSFVYVLLGSTKAITIGPSSILCLLTHDAVVQMGPGAAVLLAFFSGVASLFVGFLNLDFLVEFIAIPVIGGFTMAAALSTMTTQIKSLLGLKFSSTVSFTDTWKAVFENITETRVWDAAMGFSCIVVLLLFKMMNNIKLGKRGKRTNVQRFINCTFWFMATSRNAIVMILATLIATFFTVPHAEENPFILTGNISSGLPSFQLPPFFIGNGDESYSFIDICSNMGSTIFAVPLVALLESIGVAKSFAKGAKIDASQEMIAIGASNLLGSFVGSFPVTGSFSRTTINSGCGVHTPLGGIYTGVLVLLSLTVFTPYFSFIPKSALAATIIAAMIFMMETHLVRKIWGTKKSDIVPLIVTFFACLFLNMELGILIGTAVNFILLAYSTSRPAVNIEMLHGYLAITPDRSLIFTCMDYFISIVKKACANHPGVPIVIDLQHSSIADFSTAFVILITKGIKNLAEHLDNEGHMVLVSRCQPHVLSVLLSMKPRISVHQDGVKLHNLLNGNNQQNSESTDEISVIPIPKYLRKVVAAAKNDGIEFLSMKKLPTEQ